MGEKYATEGFVSEFEFSENEFTNSICKIKKFESYSEEWLDFIVINRDKNSKVPAHDYDIVIGPVANDKIQNTLRFFLKGKISKEDFLKMLSHHEDTHQICFCTLNSLQTIDSIDETPVFEIVTISESIIGGLINDYSFDEDKASNLFFESETYSMLSNKETELYKKEWIEIYKLLLTELQIK
jgi:hypothetical protein